MPLPSITDCLSVRWLARDLNQMSVGYVLYCHAAQY